MKKPMMESFVQFADDGRIAVRVVRWERQKRVDMRLEFLDASKKWRSTKSGFFGPMWMAKELAGILQGVAELEERGDFEREAEWFEGPRDHKEAGQ